MVTAHFWGGLNKVQRGKLSCLRTQSKGQGPTQTKSFFCDLSTMTLVHWRLIIGKSMHTLVFFSPDHQQFSNLMTISLASLNIGVAQINKWKPRDMFVLSATNRKHNYESWECCLTNKLIKNSRASLKYKLHSRQQGEAGFDSCEITTLKYFYIMWSSLEVCLLDLVRDHANELP